MIKNVLGEIATLPFYIWANEDCDNATDDWSAAKAIRQCLASSGASSVYITDADGVEVVDSEVIAQEQAEQPKVCPTCQPLESPPGGYFIMIDYEQSADHHSTLTAARQRGQELCDAEPLPSTWSIHDEQGNLVEMIRRTDVKALEQSVLEFNDRHGQSLAQAA